MIAIEQRDRQITNFEEMDKPLDDDVRAQWKQRVDMWWAGQRQDNPFLLPMIGTFDCLYAT